MITDGEAMEHQEVPGKKRELSFTRAFALGFGAPALLVSGAQLELRTLKRGETLQHAWSNVGAHLSRSMRRIANERRDT